MTSPGVPPVPPLNAKLGFADPVWARWLQQLQSRIATSVVALTINNANGFEGSVAVDSSGNASVTLSVAASGILKGVGGQIESAIPGVDYLTGLSGSFPIDVTPGLTTNISMPQASGAASGWLSSGDWLTFNSKLAGNQTITLSGDVTGTGATAITTALAVSGVAAGVYGSGTVIPQLTVDAKGRITLGANVAVSSIFPTSVKVSVIGQGFAAKEGTNAKQGIATLAAGTVTIANTSITAVSRIFLSAQDNLTLGSLRVSARTVGTSFVVTSSLATDTGDVAYEIFEPA